MASAHHRGVQLFKHTISPKCILIPLTASKALPEKFCRPRSAAEYLHGQAQVHPREVFEDIGNFDITARVRSDFAFSRPQAWTVDTNQEIRASAGIRCTSPSTNSLLDSRAAGS